jgi:plasmid stability protein
MTAHQARMTIDLPEAEHKKLKAIAAILGTSLKDLVLNCLRTNLLSKNVPNDETLRVLKETDKRQNLVHFKDVYDLIDKLGLK